MDGAKHLSDRTPHGMSILPAISTRFPEEKTESIVGALAGAQEHRQLLPRTLEAGGVGRATRALILEALGGESRDPRLVGIAKLQGVEEGKAVGMMDPAIRGIIIILTPGATTSTKMTGPILGLMHPSHSRAGEATVEVGVKAGVVVEIVPEEGPVITGEKLKKVPAQWAGTVTATGPALDVGVNQVEPTPAAVTPG